MVKNGMEKSEALKGAIVAWESEDARRPVVAITVDKGELYTPP